MPDRLTVLHWLEQVPKFREFYEFSREGYADDIAMDVINIVDDEDISLPDARLMMDVRKWLAARIAPNKYGDKRSRAGKRSRRRRL